MHCMPQVDANVANTSALLCHGPQQLGSSFRFLHYKGWWAATIRICGIAGPGSGRYGNTVSLQGRGRGLSKEAVQRIVGLTGPGSTSLTNNP
eukprot:15450130-Alexandrium_andersonii.AAC.1